MNTKTESLGPKGHLLHKITLPRSGDIADPPNRWKQTQGVIVCKTPVIVRQRNMFLNERTEQNSI